MPEIDRIEELLTYVQRQVSERSSQQPVKVSVSSCFSSLMCCKRDNGYSKVQNTDIVELLSDNLIGEIGPLLEALQEYQGTLCTKDTLASNDALSESDTSQEKAEAINWAIQRFLSSDDTAILDEGVSTRLQQVLAIRTLISSNVETLLCDDRCCVTSLFYSSSKFIDKPTSAAENDFIVACKTGLIPAINEKKEQCEVNGNEMFKLT